MNGFLEALRRYLRGPSIAGLLRRFDIDPHRYWLLIDLFGELTDRREMLGHLGRDGITLKFASLLYAGVTALVAMIEVAIEVPVSTYLVTFLGITAFLLGTILLSETANSLVNPVEGMVLAHQPINGATYTAAKLSHLLRVLTYVIPALNLIPALAGLFLPHAKWSYPLLHFSAASVLGLLIALSCCAVFGWLIRIVPPARLKTIGQIAESAPLLLILTGNILGRRLKTLHLSRAIPSDPIVLWAVAIAGAGLAILGVVFGLRALSGDYLVRVAAIVHGGSHAPARPARRTPIAALIARLAGGPAGRQPARAGFEYVRRMMFRDWQFRRQLIPMLPTTVMLLGAVAGGVRTSPFSGPFTPIHLLPHALGVMLFFVTIILAHGSDYKGTWIFLTVPGGTWHGFVRGVHALLWTVVILFPHVILSPVFAWYWGVPDALLFSAFSLSLASLYLAVELRLIEGVPFGKPVDTNRGMMLFPLIMGGLLVIAMVVAIQHYLLFHSRLLVLAATIFTAIAARFLTSASLHTFEIAIRYHLGLASQESTMLYKEVA